MFVVTTLQERESKKKKCFENEILRKNWRGNAKFSIGGCMKECRGDPACQGFSYRSLFFILKLWWPCESRKKTAKWTFLRVKTKIHINPVIVIHEIAVITAFGPQKQNKKGSWKFSSPNQNSSNVGRIQPVDSLRSATVPLFVSDTFFFA